MKGVDDILDPCPFRISERNRGLGIPLGRVGAVEEVFVKVIEDMVLEVSHNRDASEVRAASTRRTVIVAPQNYPSSISQPPVLIYEGLEVGGQVTIVGLVLRLPEDVRIGCLGSI